MHSRIYCKLLQYFNILNIVRVFDSIIHTSRLSTILFGFLPEKLLSHKFSRKFIENRHNNHARQQCLRDTYFWVIVHAVETKNPAYILLYYGCAGETLPPRRKDCTARRIRVYQLVVWFGHKTSNLTGRGWIFSIHTCKR